MKKLIKYTLSAILFIFLLTFIYINFFFDLNNYKNEIQSLISEKIDYNFKYEGIIKVSYTTTLNASIPNIEISDSDTREIIAKIQRLDIDIDFSDFMNDKITVNNISAHNLKYFGINIDNTIIETYSILKHGKYPSFNQRNNNHTNFIYIKGTGDINKNILDINDIDIETALVKGRAQGVINLESKITDIKIISKLKDDDVTKKNYGENYPDDLVGEVVPIIVSGKLNNPDVNVDIGLLIKKKIVEPLKDKAKEILKKTIEEKIKIELPF